MKTFVYLLLTVLSFNLPVLSQEKDDDDQDSERSSYSYWRKTKLGGAGGVTPVAGIFDYKEMDTYLKNAKLPTLGSDPMYLIGGEGYGYIMFLKNVRMGGFGVSGKKSVNAIDLDTLGRELKKEVDYEVTYGGFLIDYVQPIAYRLDFAFGASIGAGEVNLTMRRDDGKLKKWDNLWTEYGNQYAQSANYTRRLNGTFVVFNPRVSIEYTVLTWMQIRIGAGYPIMFSPEWQLDEKYEVNNVPTKIKTNGYTVNAGIMFGYFGW